MPPSLAALFELDYCDGCGEYRAIVETVTEEIVLYGERAGVVTCQYCWQCADEMKETDQ